MVSFGVLGRVWGFVILFTNGIVASLTNIICDLTLVERFTIYTLLDQSKLDREAEKLEFALLLRLLPELNVAPLSAPYTALNCTFVVKMTGSKGLNKH